MKKYKFKVLILCLIISINGFSQSENKTDSIIALKNYLGISIGLVNNFHTDLVDGKSFIGNYKTFSLGENYTRPLNKRWELTLESNIHIGGNIKNNFYSNGKGYSYEMYKTGIEIPISFRYLLKSNNKISWFPHFVQFGPAFSYNLSANQGVRLYQNVNYESAGRIYIPNFENGFTTSFRIGTGFTFQFTHSVIRAELNYAHSFNSLKNNTIPLVNLTSVTNDALIVSMVIDSRYKKIKNKAPKFKMSPFKSLLQNNKTKKL